MLYAMILEVINYLLIHLLSLFIILPFTLNLLRTFYLFIFYQCYI